MARDDIVIGLDIGTTKVCTVIGHGNDEGIVTIAGVGISPSRGVKKGVVVDVDDTVAAIRDSVERAAHMAGVTARAVVAGVTGDHVVSSNRIGTVTISGQAGVVTENDVGRVMHAAAMDVPRDREIIHSLPRDFSVDGHKGVRRPVGMCGERLEVETHVVTGAAGFLQNVVQCVERSGLEVDALVLEPIATSEAVATPDERELGVALIDIGGGTSDIAVFLDGSVAFSAAIAVGGNHVTRDISIGLRTPFEIAEKLKLERGIAMPSLIPHGEALEVVSAGSGEKLRLPRAILGEIIEARMSELFEMARAAMDKAGVQNRLGGGVILTGGGAMLPGAEELASEIFNLPIRVGTPINLAGWTDKVDTPQFATGVGLLRFAMRQPGTLGNPLATTANPQMSPAMADRRRRVWSAPNSGLSVPAKSTSRNWAPAVVDVAVPQPRFGSGSTHLKPNGVGGSNGTSPSRSTTSGVTARSTEVEAAPASSGMLRDPETVLQAATAPVTQAVSTTTVSAPRVVAAPIVGTPPVQQTAAVAPQVVSPSPQPVQRAVETVDYMGGSSAPGTTASNGVGPIRQEGEAQNGDGPPVKKLVTRLKDMLGWDPS